MEESSGGRGSGAGRRGCRGAPAPAPPPATPRAVLLRRVAGILRKSEALRSAEEVDMLATKKDIVREAKVRIRQRQETLDRSKEVEDDADVLMAKCRDLAAAVESAQHLVVYTGAGISTAADIPDYRGPNGIWTLLQKGKKIGKHDLTRADPTLTHMALCKLYKKRYLKFVVSQNCDGLHLRSGLPKRALSEVHGNMYLEICKSCKPNVQYWRLFDTTERTARFFHKTGRICHVCGGSLEDSIVHFGERGVARWPLNWTGAIHHASKADVILCLGSSLKVLKKYPWLWAMDKPVKKRPAVFIVNLQWTPKDDIAALKINGRCDKVMELLMEYMGLETPKYSRQYDPIFAHTSYLTPLELHTTTQPMLVRKVDNSEEFHEEKRDEDNKLTSPVTNMETDDTDDDCPLNILKIKMKERDCPENLSMDKHTGEKCFENGQNDQTAKTCDNFSFNINNYSCPYSLTKIAKKENILDKSILSNKVIDIQESNNRFIKSNALDLTFPFKSPVENLTNYNNTSDLGANCSSSSDYSNTFEALALGLTSDDFERIHVEMKTSNNEVSTVSILLVNQSKFALNGYRNIEKDSSDQVCTKSQTNINICSMLNGINKSTNGIEKKATIQSFGFPSSPEHNNNEKIKKSLTISQLFTNKNLLGKDNLNFILDKSKIRSESIQINNIGAETKMDLQPLDLSFTINLDAPSYFFKNHYQTSNPNLSIQVYSNPNAESIDNRTVTNLEPIESAIDLRSKNSIDNLNREIRFNEFLNRKHKNHFQKKYESFAKVIIQNTILVNHRELQNAYSGLHSIIDPMPFCADYDFGSVFNSFSFIRLAQRLMSKGKVNAIKDNVKRKRKFVKRLCARKRRQEPRCKFCHEHYKTSMCNFYEPYNSEKRFERWRNGKLIMCECCDTDTSDVEEDEDGGSSVSCDETDDQQKDVKDNSQNDSVDVKTTQDDVQAGWFGKGFRKGRRRR